MPEISIPDPAECSPGPCSISLRPPLVPEHEYKQVRHGSTVVDPYHWLRQKSNPEVLNYLEAENSYTKAVTKELEPFVEELYGEMLTRIKQTDLSVPVRRGEYLYYNRTQEGKQYPIHCRRKGNMDAPEEILLDQNELAAGKRFLEFGALVVSDDQNLLAYTVDFTGFRQYQLHVKDLQTGKTLPDTAQRVTSLEWASDNRTIFLVTEDAVTKRSDTLLRHKLGERDSETLYQEEDELYDIWLERSRDKKFVFLVISSKDTTEIRYLPAQSPQATLAVFLPRENGHRYYVEHRENLFYVRTNRGGKDFRVITVPEDGEHTEENWTEFIPYTPGTLIERIDPYRDFAVAVEKAEALERLRFYDFATTIWSILQFPEPAYALFASGSPDFDSDGYRYSYQSFLTPPSVYDFHPKSSKSVLLKQEEVLGGYDPAQFVSERVWVTARDGAKVPVSLAYKKGFERNGTVPLLLYGYGSYGIGLSATFSSARLSLLSRGMTYAIAHIRGGDELGEQWREDGMLMKKKNTFQDFIDVAEYLITNDWTSRDRLVIEGGSAGGLLMGAVVNMRPDLFRAVHLAVPFVDVMNTMMDASLPLTVGEYLEWGNPNDKAAYDYMMSYSPYDNLKEGNYPAMLVTTSLNDSQVMYWEPAKYVAKLRTLKRDNNPLLFKIKMEPAGHGGASGRYDRLKDTAFEYAWMLSQVGIDT